MTSLEFVFAFMMSTFNLELEWSESESKMYLFIIFKKLTNQLSGEDDKDFN